MQGTRASGSAGGQAHRAGQSASSRRQDAGHSAGKGQGHRKDARASSSARGRTQGHEQRAKASGSGAPGAGQGAVSRRGHSQGHGQGRWKDGGISGTGKGADDRGWDPWHGPEGKGEGVRPSLGLGAWGGGQVQGGQGRRRPPGTSRA